MGVPQILKGGRFFDEHGQRVKRPGMRYRENGARILY